VALLGQVPALMMLLAASLGLMIGPLADHAGYRRTMPICLLAVVTSSLATGLAATLPLLVLAALVGAVGRAAIMPVAQAIVATACGDDTAAATPYKWLRVSDTAERSQVDQHIPQQLHPIVPVLDAFKAEE
jgi:MFS family permease